MRKRLVQLVALLLVVILVMSHLAYAAGAQEEGTSGQTDIEAKIKDYLDKLTDALMNVMALLRDSMVGEHDYWYHYGLTLDTSTASVNPPLILPKNNNSRLAILVIQTPHTDNLKNEMVITCNLKLGTVPYVYTVTPAVFPSLPPSSIIPNALAILQGMVQDTPLNLEGGTSSSYQWSLIPYGPVLLLQLPPNLITDSNANDKNDKNEPKLANELKKRISGSLSDEKIEFVANHSEYYLHNVTISYESVYVDNVQKFCYLGKYIDLQVGVKPSELPEELVKWLKEQIDEYVSSAIDEKVKELVGATEHKLNEIFSTLVNDLKSIMCDDLKRDLSSRVDGTITNFECTLRSQPEIHIDISTLEEHVRSVVLRTVENFLKRLYSDVGSANEPIVYIEISVDLNAKTSLELSGYGKRLSGSGSTSINAVRFSIVIGKSFYIPLSTEKAPDLKLGLGIILAISGVDFSIKVMRSGNYKYFAVFIRGTLSDATLKGLIKMAVEHSLWYQLAAAIKGYDNLPSCGKSPGRSPRHITKLLNEKFINDYENEMVNKILGLARSWLGEEASKLLNSYINDLFQRYNDELSNANTLVYASENKKRRLEIVVFEGDDVGIPPFYCPGCSDDDIARYLNKIIPYHMYSEKPDTIKLIKKYIGKVGGNDNTGNNQQIVKVAADTVKLNTQWHTQAGVFTVSVKQKATDTVEIVVEPSSDSINAVINEIKGNMPTNFDIQSKINDGTVDIEISASISSATDMITYLSNYAELYAKLVNKIVGTVYVGVVLPRSLATAEFMFSEKKVEKKNLDVAAVSGEEGISDAVNASNSLSVEGCLEYEVRVGNETEKHTICDTRSTEVNVQSATLTLSFKPSVTHMAQPITGKVSYNKPHINIVYAPINIKIKVSFNYKISLCLSERALLQKPFIMTYAGVAPYTGLGFPGYFVGAIKDLLWGAEASTSGPLDQQIEEVEDSFASKFLKLLSYLGIPGYIVPGLPLADESADLSDTVAYAVKGEYVGLTIFEGMQYTMPESIYLSLLLSEIVSPTLLTIMFEQLKVECDSCNFAYISYDSASGAFNVETGAKKITLCNLLVGLGLIPEAGVSIYSMPSRPEAPKLGGIISQEEESKVSKDKLSGFWGSFKKVLDVLGGVLGSIVCANSLDQLRVNALAYLKVYKGGLHVQVGKVKKLAFLELSNANLNYRIVALRSGEIKVYKTLFVLVVKKAPILPGVIPLLIPLDLNCKIASIHLEVIDPSEVKIHPLGYTLDSKGILRIYTAVGIEHKNDNAEGGIKEIRGLLIGRGSYSQLGLRSSYYPEIIGYKVALYDPKEKRIVGRPGALTVLGIARPVEVNIRHLRPGVYKLALLSESGIVGICNDPECTVYIFKPDVKLWSFEVKGDEYRAVMQVFYTLNERAHYSLLHTTRTFNIQINKEKVVEFVNDIARRILGSLILGAAQTLIVGGAEKLDDILSKRLGKKLNIERYAQNLVDMYKVMLDESADFLGAEETSTACNLYYVLDEILSETLNIVSDELGELLDSILSAILEELIEQVVLLVTKLLLPVNVAAFADIISDAVNTVSLHFDAKSFVVSLGTAVVYRATYIASYAMLNCIISATLNKVDRVVGYATDIANVLLSKLSMYIDDTLQEMLPLVMHEDVIISMKYLVSMLDSDNGYLPIVALVLKVGAKDSINYGIVGVVSVQGRRGDRLLITPVTLESILGLPLFYLGYNKDYTMYSISLSGIAGALSDAIASAVEAFAAGTSIAKALGISKDTMLKTGSRSSLPDLGKRLHSAQTTSTTIDLTPGLLYRIGYDNIDLINTLDSLRDALNTELKLTLSEKLGKLSEFISVQINIYLAPSLTSLGLLIDMHNLLTDHIIRIKPGIYVMPPVSLSLRDS